MDVEVPVLKRMFAKRVKAYKSMGVQSENDGADVPKDLMSQISMTVL